MTNNGEESFERNYEEGAELEETTSSEGDVEASSQGRRQLLEETLKTQLERQTKHNREKEKKQDRAKEETKKLEDKYEQSVENIPQTADWDLNQETPAEELVADLEYDGELGVRDYAEHQSEQIEGLTGTLRKFRGMMDSKNEKIEELEEEKASLDQQEEEEIPNILNQIDEMGEEDLGEGQTFDELETYERRSFENTYDRDRAEIEDEIEDLEKTIVELARRKQDYSLERGTRRDETQQVYNEFVSEAESVVTDNYQALRESLKELRDLEIDQQVYEQLSVEASDEESTLNQGQQEQYEARRDAGLAYVDSALDEIDEIEAVVSDHERVVEALSAPAKVNTRDLEGIYDGLIEPSYAEEDDEYGTEALRNRVQDAASEITGESYDSLRELRDIVDEME